VGLQLTVTGCGGTMIEPGIPTPQEVGDELGQLFATGLVDPAAVLLRYDPLLRVKAPDGKVLRNDTARAFRHVASLFSKLGVSAATTKFLLRSHPRDKRYRHVYERMVENGLAPLPPGDIHEVFQELTQVAPEYGIALQTCCVREEQKTASWGHDGGCLCGPRLTEVGKRRFGSSWNRISPMNRPSRPGCLCSLYWDLSVNRGLKRCGGGSAGCIYCTSSAKKFGPRLLQTLQEEREWYLSGKRLKAYEHLMEA